MLMLPKLLDTTTTTNRATAPTSKVLETESLFFLYRYCVLYIVCFHNLIRHQEWYLKDMQQQSPFLYLKTLQVFRAATT